MSFLPRLLEGAGWFPIEEAPKNGTYVILRGVSGYLGTPHRLIVARYDRQFRPRQPWVDCAGDSVLDSGEMPTQFMHLETAAVLAEIVKEYTEAMQTIKNYGVRYRGMEEHFLKVADASLKRAEELALRLLNKGESI